MGFLRLFLNWNAKHHGGARSWSNGVYNQSTTRLSSPGWTIYFTDVKVPGDQQLEFAELCLSILNRFIQRRPETCSSLVEGHLDIRGKLI